MKSQKEDAREAVKRAVKAGTLVRPETCSQCDAADRIEAHHRDYSKPLEVEWLCRDCHALAHRELKRVAVNRDGLLTLGEARMTRKRTQAEVAQTMGVSQARVATLEKAENMAVETLIAYGNALGGEVRLAVAFPDGDRYLLN